MASLSFCTPACFFGARMSDALFSASPSHLYFHPHPALKKYIAHYTLSPPCVSGPAHQTLIPDASGCLVFAFGPSGIQAHFWGPTTHTVEVYNDFKQTPYRFFVEFLPGGAHQLLGLSVKDAVDLRIPLADADAALYSAFLALFSKSSCMHTLLAGIDALFCQYINSEKTDSLAEQLLCCLHAPTTSLSSESLSKTLHYSARHLSRRIQPVLGLSLRQYLRLQRINHALAGMGQTPSLSYLAQTLGYYDQAHFNHDFKSVCGVSPTIYQQNLSDFYKETHKFPTTLF